MKQKKISFRLVAYTDAAGKFSSEAFRSGNEDNFYIVDDISNPSTNKGAQDEIIQLGHCGMLMVVADGMGGMNAGEVASQIAVDTVKRAFATENLTESIIETAHSRQKYLEQVIKTADKNIKSEAKKDSSREGMGSTIIMAWLFNDELTLSWCGDSRAYIFNEKSGIRLISEDHSYVQELVNKGLLTYDQTFDHPQNNIITRSLGDPTKDVKPESKQFKIGKGDIILLCSDGLSGVLRDRKTYDASGKLYPEENIEDIVRLHTSSMKECREALWLAAERNGWYDNVTVILCQITDGPESVWASAPVVEPSSKKSSKGRILWTILVAVVVIFSLAVAFYLGRNSNGINIEKQTDSIPDITNDSIVAKDSLKIQHKDVVKKDATPKEQQEKPSISRQVKEQNASNDSSINSSTKLTPIHRDSYKQDGKDKLTPIQNKSKNNLPDNPLNNQPKNHNSKAENELIK